MSAPTQPEHWIPVADRLPPEDQQVLILVADPTVAIEATPAVARLRVEFKGTDHPRADWWAGIPGRYFALSADGWIVTHWTPMPTWRDGHRLTRGSCLGTPDGR